MGGNRWRRKISEILAERVVCENYLGQEEGLSEKERQQSITEYMSLHCAMEKCLYLTGAVMLKCMASEGDTVFQPVNHDVDIGGEPAIASTDCVVGKHITPFGICEGQSKKKSEIVYCDPKIAHNKWLESCLKMKVGDAESVNENSYLICTRDEDGYIYPVLGNGMNGEGASIEEQIQELMNQITGEEIISYKLEDMVQLPTVEILARMIYQEDHSPNGGRQNAIAFSVVNRLYFGNWCGDNDNNLYGVLISPGQYKSILNATDAQKKTSQGQHNAYWPPIEENADQTEKDGWENAKRLAAILYLAVETCVEEDDDTGRGKCVEAKNDDMREDIIEFMEEQVDCDGNEIKNIIGYYQSFRRSDSKISASDYEKQNKIVFVENGKVVGNVFQEK